MPSILITGCSSGIGYDTAKQLHALGWRVFASCRKEADVERLRAEGLECLPLDITDESQIEAAFAYIDQQGPLDALFCNAGYGQTGAVEDIPAAALREQFNTNVIGTWMCITHAMKRFRQTGHGKILVNSSILGFAAFPFRGPYNASKFALEGMCDTMRNELHGSNIYISLLEPGPIATRFRPNALAKFQQYIDIENSPYKERYQRQLARLEKKGATTPFTMSSPDCAKICVQALCAKKPKARYQVTFPTKLFWKLRRFLPTWWFDHLLRKSGE